jgi:hypothetical protein
VRGDVVKMRGPGGASGASTALAGSWERLKGGRVSGAGAGLAGLREWPKAGTEEVVERSTHSTSVSGGTLKNAHHRRLAMQLSNMDKEGGKTPGRHRRATTQLDGTSYTPKNGAAPLASSWWRCVRAFTFPPGALTRSRPAGGPARVGRACGSTEGCVGIVGGFGEWRGLRHGWGVWGVEGGEASVAGRDGRAEKRREDIAGGKRTR